MMIAKKVLKCLYQWPRYGIGIFSHCADF